MGNYQIIRSLGKGGMGEVFLAHDPICERDVALKKIRADWIQNKTMQERFLREAKIASQLTHPSIIPIYAIHQEKEQIFYTMPYIEGETLKAILRQSRLLEKKGGTHPIGSSIPALIRIFLNVCSAAAYAHSRGILHRDLKPENIIVGKYGEVIILDWGLANYIGSEEAAKATIPGTLAYMAPERAFGSASSIQSDLYSLGVILYQLLTLQLPFQRRDIKEFRRHFKHETLLDPEELAPDRDISPQLSDIVKSCLHPDPLLRIQTMQELIAALEKYIEGLPEWILSTTLHINKKEDWEFQENILLAKHMAIARQPDLMEWISVMISKAAFIENVMVETTLVLGKTAEGVGFLFGKSFDESFALWIGSQSHPGVRLYRGHVEVVSHPEIALKPDISYQIRIEKLGNHFRFSLGGLFQFGYLSHLPVLGKQVGLFYKDADFQMEGLNVFIGSQNVMVNCLSIPDAFLARKNFSQAETEYRRIASAFRGRREGREAIFRTGITLLEEGLSQKKKKRSFYARALEEFEKLHATPGAPLEYLGKSLVYKAAKEIEEETKCLELALRRFPNHPLKPLLEEQILSRLHESARADRKAAFHFALLAIRYLPHVKEHPDHRTLLESLRNHLEPLYFLPHTEGSMAVELAFWLDKPMTLVELLGQEAAPILAQLRYNTGPDASDLAHIERAIDEQKVKEVEKIDMPPLYRIWIYLLQNRWSQAAKLLKKAPAESDPLFFLYGCLLAARKGEKASAQFLTDVMISAPPPLSLLLSHFLLGRIELKKLFYWEKVHLFRQLQLYYHCCKRRKLKAFFSKKLQRLRAKRRSDILSQYVRAP